MIRPSSISIREPTSISVGNRCKWDGQQSVSVGYLASAMDDNTVAIGSVVSSIHKNATVLGTNLTSKRENSTLLNQVEFTEDGLYMNSGAGIVSTSEKRATYICTACQNPIVHGVKWIVEESIVEEVVDMGLCFGCVLGCVLDFKARMSWDINSKQV